MAGLDDLPEELLVSIVGSFLPIPRTLPQPVQAEAARDAENKTRKTALWSLCLSSSRLFRIANPILYSAIVISDSSLAATARLSKLLRVLADHSLLTKDINYLEYSSRHNNDHTRDSRRLESAAFWQNEVPPNLDDLHSRLCESGLAPCYCTQAELEAKLPLETKVFAKAAEFLKAARLHNWTRGLFKHPESARLALLTLLAPNITHLNLSIMEVTDWVAYDIFDFIGLVDPDYNLRSADARSLQRLERFDISSSRSSTASEANRRYPVFIPNTIYKLPALRHYIQSGPCFSEPGRPGTQKLETLHLQDSTMLLDDTARLIGRSGRLKELSHWISASAVGTLNFTELWQPLRTNKDSLQFLMIAIGGDGRSELFINGSLGSFADFVNLKTLFISEVAFLGKPDDFVAPVGQVAWSPYRWISYKPTFRISERLPLSLETLKISADLTFWSDHTELLSDLADDLDQLPTLRTVEVVRNVGFECPKLTTLFAGRAVAFSLKRVPDGDYADYLKGECVAMLGNNC